MIKQIITSKFSACFHLKNRKHTIFFFFWSKRELRIENNRWGIWKCEVSNNELRPKNKPSLGHEVNCWAYMNYSHYQAFKFQLGLLWTPTHLEVKFRWNYKTDQNFLENYLNLNKINIFGFTFECFMYFLSFFTNLIEKGWWYYLLLRLFAHVIKKLRNCLQSTR